MRLKMAENSLFAVLLRSSWWISLAIAAGIALVSRALLPDDLWLFGAFGGFPFLVIAVIAARRQLAAPSARRIAATVESVSAMAWPEFAQALERGLTRDGHAVQRLDGAGADFALERGGRRTLLAARRWKAARTGIEPLRELHAAIQAADAHDGLYVAPGAVTDAARQFAANHAIRLIDGAALAQLLRR